VVIIYRFKCLVTTLPIIYTNWQQLKTKSKLLLIMSKIKKPIFLFIIFSLILISIPTNLRAQNSRDSIPLTKEIINQWTEELSNWGRWGEDDELGTSNLVLHKTERSSLASN
jgi:hypothetical protein